MPSKIKLSQVGDRTLQILFALEKKAKEFYPKTKEEWDLYFNSTPLPKEELSFFKELFFNLLEKNAGDVDKSMEDLESMTPDISEHLKHKSTKELFEFFAESMSLEMQKSSTFLLQIKSLAKIFIE